MPSYVSTPLAFGLGYAFTGGDKEADNNRYSIVRL